MGSTAHLVVRGGTEALVEWALDEVARLERSWSRFLPDSDVSRLNRTTGRPVLVAAETIALVERALEMYRSTGGRFDPTILHALEANGYDETFERVRARQSPTRVLTSAPPGQDPLRVLVPARGAATARTMPGPAPGCAGVVVDRDAGTVTLPEGSGIDLGGIGKGYAADLVAGGLVARGAAAACVALGGDVRAAGAGPHDGAWLVPVEDPFDEHRCLFTYALADAAIVTSTRLFRSWIHDGRVRHHIIDPATGASADRGVAAVIVTDGDAWRAEALAKAALVAGRTGGRAVLDAHGVEAWIVDDHGAVS
jgi:FAD:protein FMN transferase